MRIQPLPPEDRRAAARYRLTPEELDHYGIRGQPGEQAKFLSFKAWSQVVRKPLTEPSSASLVDNKWLFGVYFESFGVATPRVLGLLHPVQGILRDGSPLRTMDHLVGWLRTSRLDSFVVKPVKGWNSEGIFVVDRIAWQDEEPTFFTADGQELTPEQLESQLIMTMRESTGCVVQERCRPHAWYSEIGIGSSNVVRVVTFVPDDGEAEVQAAVLFAGRSGHMVNSWTNGALSIPIDLERGTLGRGRMLPEFGTTQLTHHPDFGGHFTGATVPGWEEIRQLCVHAVRVTPGLRLVCWEVLLTDEGPKLLEGNLAFGLAMLQVHTDGFMAPDGIARRWADAGAELPDGTVSWMKQHGILYPGAPSARLKRLVGRFLHD